jgi:hypothetical protein
MKRSVLLAVGLMVGVLRLCGNEAQGRCPAEPGDPVAGLEARATVARAGTGYEVRFILKNVSDRPIVIYDWVGAMPLRVDWVGPDGKKRAVGAYDWLRAVRLAPPNRDNYKLFYITLAPGESRLLSHGDGTNGAIRLPGIAAGKNRVRITYANRTTGKEFGLKGTWVGRVSAEVTFVARELPALEMGERAYRAHVGDRLDFVFSFPRAVPGAAVDSLEVMIDGKVMANPELRRSSASRGDPPGGNASLTFVYRPVVAGTYKVRIIPIDERGEKGRPRDYTVTVHGPR